MRKTKKVNQGFSLIELLIAVTILSIVMIMVVQFMSTSSAAYRKTKKNLNIQTDAMRTVEQMSDTLMQAKYIRIVTKDQGMYTITKTDVDTKNKREVAEATSYDSVDYDFVPDNYGNYAKEWSLDDTSRQVIVNFDDYTIVNEANETYPLATDKDAPAGSEVRSFRALRPDDTYLYIKPEYIYAEYYKDVEDASTGATNQVVVHVLYHITDITDSKDKTCSIYMYRYETDPADVSNNRGLSYAKYQMRDLLGKVNTAKGAANADAFTTKTDNMTVEDPEGLLTDKISDFYLSADVEGNSILTNILFKDDGYEYNAVETINLRNSNVLTVRPQKLYKVKGTGVTGGSRTGSSTSGGSGSTTP